MGKYLYSFKTECEKGGTKFNHTLFVFADNKKEAKKKIKRIHRKAPLKKIKIRKVQ